MEHLNIVIYYDNKTPSGLKNKPDQLQKLPIQTADLKEQKFEILTRTQRRTLFADLDEGENEEGASRLAICYPILWR